MSDWLLRHTEFSDAHQLHRLHKPSDKHMDMNLNLQQAYQ